MIADLEQARNLSLDERRLARRHCGSALAISILHTLICLFFLRGGYFEAGNLAFAQVFGVIWAGNMLLVALVFSGATRHWHDQSISLIWNLWLTLGFLVTAYYVDAFRLSVMVLFFAAMLLVSFRQRFLVLMLIAAFAAIGYMVVVVMAWQARSVYMNLSVEFMQWLIFSMTAISFAITGAGINALRSRLTTKNVELGDALEQVREMAIRDELTGLFNRRHVMDVLRQQQALADSGSYEFCLAVLDLDHFKRVNDTFGHGVGDQVLKRFAGIAEACLRDADYTGRFGGEEFVLVLTQVDVEGAAVVARRLCETLAKTDFTDIEPGLKQVTVSIGVAAYRPGTTLDETLARADLCLYAAKDGGRNQVVLETEMPEGNGKNEAGSPARACQGG